MVRKVALLELVGEQFEADQEQEQVGEGHPFVAEVAPQRCHPIPGREAAHQGLIGDDHGKPGEGDGERALVKQGDADQHQAEQDEFQRRAEKGGSRPAER